MKHWVYASGGRETTENSTFILFVTYGRNPILQRFASLRHPIFLGWMQELYLYCFRLNLDLYIYLVDSIEPQTINLKLSAIINLSEI